MNLGFGVRDEEVFFTQAFGLRVPKVCLLSFGSRIYTYKVEGGAA